MKYIFSFFATLLYTSMLIGQLPDAFSFQALVMDLNGDLVTEEVVDIRLALIAETPMSNEVYEEFHTVTSTELGHVELEIGRGISPDGGFEDLDWTKAHFLSIELSLDGGQTFELLGISELLSVPYALQAEVSLSGEQGATGPQGQIGPKGPDGPRGPIGPQGPEGFPSQGVTGDEGPIGPAGPEGPQGISGPSGIQGATGPIGVKGRQGPSGPQGLEGDRGDVGDSGDIGVTGPQGPPGPAGGPRGEVGPQGDPGTSQGIQGPAGPQGDPGPAGAAPNCPQGPAGVAGPNGIGNMPMLTVEPTSGTFYLDDGTNRESGLPGFRFRVSENDPWLDI